MPHLLVELTVAVVTNVNAFSDEECLLADFTLSMTTLLNESYYAPHASRHSQLTHIDEVK